MKQFTLYFILIASVYSNVYADSKWFHRQSSEHLAEKIQEELDLTDEQYKNVEQILKENRLIVSAKVRELKEQIYKIRDEIYQSKPKLDVIKKEVEQKSKILSDMEYAAIVRDLRLKAQFNAEQVEEWRDISQRRHPRSSMGPRFFRNYSSHDRHGRHEKEDDFDDEFSDEEFQKEFRAEQKTELAMIMEELREDMQLSEEQFKQVENILQESSQTLFDARSKLLAQFWKIRKELLKEKPDLKNIRQYLNEKSAILAEMEYTSIARDLRLQAILPQEELEDWEEEVSERFMFRGGRNPHEPFMMIKNKKK